MLKTKNNILLGAVLLGSLFSSHSMGVEKTNEGNTPDVHLPPDSGKKSLFRGNEKKPKMEKAPPLSEPRTVQSARALWKLLREAKALSNQEQQLIKLGTLTLDVPEGHRKEVTPYINEDYISALNIPSYLIVRNFIQDISGIKKTTTWRTLGDSSEDDSIDEIHDWLNRIAKSSTSRGADTAYHVLSIHNATQEQADEILNAPTIAHLGAVRIWLRPAPSEVRLPNPSAQPVPVTTEGNGDKKDEKAGVTEKESAPHHSAGRYGKGLLPKRQEKKPRMDRESALSAPQTLKSTRDLGALLWEAELLSRQEERLIKLGELTLDTPKEDYKKIFAWYANNKHISALRIPSCLILQNFFASSSRGQKVTVRYDLEAVSIADIRKWLGRIAKSPKPKGANTAHNILSIHNATQEQADEILKLPDISHLGGIRIWLRSAPPAEAGPSNPNEGEGQKSAPIIEEQAIEEQERADVRGDSTQGQWDEIRDDKEMGIEAWLPDPEPINLLPELKGQREERKTAETGEIAGNDSIERFAHLRQTRLKPVLVEIANQKAAFYRRLLSQPHLFDLSIVPVRTVLDLLRKAHKYSEEGNPAQVPLCLHNITKRQLSNILDDENANYIGSLKWEYREGEENVEGVDHLDEQPYPQLPDGPLPKKREAPAFEEQVFEEPEEEQNIEPSDAKEGNEEPQESDKEAPPLSLNWEKTTLKNVEPDAFGFIKSGIGLGKLQDWAPSSNTKAHDASQNWVRIYCGRYRE